MTASRHYLAVQSNTIYEDNFAALARLASTHYLEAVLELSQVFMVWCQSESDQSGKTSSVCSH